MTTISAIVTRRHIRGEVEDVIEIPARAFACPLGMVAFDKFCEDLGRSSSTVRSWVEKGWLKVDDVQGRSYIMQDSLQEFLQRVRNKEFAATSNIEKFNNGGRG